MDNSNHDLIKRIRKLEIIERECKKAREALEESEERFRRLSEATFEGIVIHEEGIILDVNKTFAEMFGY
ncbi:PAS domain S-box protein, partial [bacterium]|nr:PAS domain S-box protein [bacterium]